MYTKFSDLVFRNHLPGIAMEQAKYNGFSIIRGYGVQGIEIMYPNTGDVESGLTEQEVEAIVNR